MTIAASGSTGTGAVRVFVIHSHLDWTIVEPLVNLLQRAFDLATGVIRATSVEGMQLPVGSEVDATLVGDLRGADVAIAVITPASLRSDYVRRELTERGASGRIMPVVGPGLSRNDLPPELNRVNWVLLDGGIPALVTSVGAVLGRTPDAAFIASNRSRIDQIVAAAHQLYTEIPRPQAFEQTFADVSRDPEALWSKVVLDGAKVLREQIADGGDIFQPDLVVALNQGGMATCAMLKRWMAAPVGVAFTDLRLSRRMLSLSLPDMSAVRRILLVDTKLKTGGSALNVMTELRRSQPFEFCLAVLVAYGRWEKPRWEFPNGARWPAAFRFPLSDEQPELLTYVAYHTASTGQSDPYPEPWRNDLLLL